MAHAYTPGLQISRRTSVWKERLLPLKGQVLVQEGDRVEADTVIARAELPGDIHPVPVADRLGVPPPDLQRYMLKQEGESVEADEPIAETQPWLRFLRSVCRSPVAGTVHSISSVTGQVMIQQPPKPVQLDAYLSGTVAKVLPDEGAVVQAEAAVIQGIFGVGGECSGRLVAAAQSPSEQLAEESVDESWRGRAVVVGGLIDPSVVRAAAEVGAAALIGAGISAQDLDGLLGYEIGVAVTGSEDIGLTLVLTEGFGPMAMAANTFALLAELEGRTASVNGATQIRAGVRRPEVIVPLEGDAGAEMRQSEGQEPGGLGLGDRVRLIREPFFGMMGTVKSLTSDLTTIDTEARLRVMDVELTDGRVVTVPRANVEVIES